jgi:hypothetical protein
MFQQTSQSDGAGKGSTINTGVSGLGTAIGIGASILAIGPVFEHTRLAVFLYLFKTFGRGLSIFLTYAFGAVEAVIIYYIVKLLFTSFAIWSFAALAARRFPTG